MVNIEKRKEKKAARLPKYIQKKEDVREIEWKYIDETSDIIADSDMDVDLVHIQDEFRDNVLAWLLTSSYERYRAILTKKGEKAISQNKYASEVVKIDPQLFSMYKTNIRRPRSSNLDILAEHYGQVVYDIMGMPRRVAIDKRLAQIESLWPRVDDQIKDELVALIQDHIKR